MKILVTGGAGFIGSHLVDRFLREGHEVAVMDNLSTGRREQVSAEARWYEMDIRDPEVARVFERERPEVVCHHAAQLDVRISMREPVFDTDVNVLGSVRLLELSAQHNVDKFLFASTGGAVYGDAYIPASEEDAPHPISNYGVAKLSVEHYLHCYHVNHGLNYMALRYANVYGPRQNPHGEAGVVAIFTRKMLDGERVTINGDGLQTRDYVYVGDVVEANIRALQTDVTGAYNIGTGVETTVAALYERLSAIIGVDEPPVYGPAKIGEQRRSVLTCARARSDFGWTPRIELGKGLEETVTYFKGVGNDE